MTNHERADMLIKTIKIWEFLQHVDELIDNGDSAAVAIADDFFSRYSLSVTDAKNNGILPWVQMKTNLSILLVTICFARQQKWNRAGMKSLQKYEIDCNGINSPDIDKVITIIRNAVVHEFNRGGQYSFSQVWRRFLSED